jgi:glycosyltransferase involved in cell wall biosynthesis
MQNTYDVSIIMPVFNTGRLLRETIASVDSQVEYQGSPVPSYQVIIVDDYSDDNKTIELLEQLEKKIDYRIIKNCKGKGVSGARNTGVGISDSDWIVFLDSDDLLLPTALSCTFYYVKQNRNIGWITGASYIFNNGDSIEHIELKKSSPILYGYVGANFDSGTISRLIHPTAKLLKSCFINSQNVWVRKELLKGQDTFDEKLQRAEDYKLWLELSVTNDLYYLPYHLAAYRQRDGSITSGLQPTFSGEDTMLFSLMRNPVFNQYRSEIYSKLLFVLVDHCYFYRKYGTFSQALRASADLIKVFPKKIISWKMLLASLIGK